VLHRTSEESLLRGVAVDAAMMFLFAVALGIALIFPTVGYFALFIMFLTGPVQAAFARLLLHKSVRSEQDRRKR